MESNARAEMVQAAVSYLLGRSRLAGRAPSGRMGGPGRDAARPEPDTLTLRLVAELTDRSFTAPIYHFPDRTCLIAATAAEGFTMLVEHLRDASLSNPSAGSVALETALRYAEWGIEHEPLFAAMYDPSLANDLALMMTTRGPVEPELMRVHGGSEDAARKRARAFNDLLDGKKKALEVFEERIERDQRSGVLIPGGPMQIAHTLTATADGLVWQWITERQGSRIDMLRHAEQCLGLLYRGLRG